MSFRASLPLLALLAAAAGVAAWRGKAQEPSAARRTAVPSRPVPKSWQTTLRDKPYTVYAEHFPGKDWGERINRAIDAVRAGRDGGEVVLPPTLLEVSTTIDLRGTVRNYPKGGVRGVILRGAGGAQTTQLVWKGKPHQALIDMSGAWHCRVKDLWLDGNNVEGVIGLRFGGGWDRGYNGGKVSAVEGLHIWKCDVGLEIGDLFGPDLVGCSFRDLWIWQVRVGVRVLGANVAMMQFHNLSLASYRETGIQLVGHAGRVVRPRAEADRPTKENVLRTPDGREVFREELPPFVVSSGRLQRKGPTRPSVGGGYPELVVYGLQAHSDRKEAWLVDTNWAPLRIYSARIEGPGGVLRFSSTMGGVRHNVVLVDVSATSRGTGANGNVIEFHGRGPLYLVGCSLNGNVALGSTQVFSTGTHFLKKKAGFVSLPGSTPVVHESHAAWQHTARVPTRASSVVVKLEGVHRQPDGAYQVLVTPGWKAGSCWVTDKGRDGFTVHFEHPPPRDAQADVVVTRPPFRASETPY